jgi:hypothetical protein
MRAHSRLFLPVLISLMGCKPPEAPKEYEALLGYIFEHTADEDDEALVVGLDNLADWLQDDQLTEAQAGYTLGTIPDAAIQGLAGHAHTNDGLEGVSLVTQSGYGGKKLMEALTQYSFKTIMPDVYLTYDRSFDEGKRCIVDRDCLWADGSVYTLADWGLLGEVEADRRIEFRWVNTGSGWVFLQRWWLTAPSTGTKLDLRIQDQYYIGINYKGGSGTRRVHASWLTMEMSTGDQTSNGSKQLIKNWEKDADDLDAWMDENL